MQSERPWWIRLAQENRLWGDDPMVGALANLAIRSVTGTVAPSSRVCIAPAPSAQTTTTCRSSSAAYGRAGGHRLLHREVWTLVGSMTYDVLFSSTLQSESPCDRRYTHPHEVWMV